ncbi:MAG: hypothetical protein Tsb0034_00870 [Ekhidna sp.]
MRELKKSQTADQEHWLENLDRIQDSTRKNYFSVLPEESELLKHFSDAFVINNPKGRVGGDGYWLHTTGSDAYLALFTCVGEGHLANMMIRIYMEALKKMVDGYSIDFPGSILQFLHREVLAKFKNKNNILLNTNANVGIVKLNKKTKVMEFAGANMNLIQVHRRGVRIIQGEEHQVGEKSENVRSYSSNTIEDVEDSNFFLCSTGVFNLLGGPSFTKLDVQGLGDFLRDNRKELMQYQRKLLEKYLGEWTGSSGQNDDIMVIGFKA